MLLCAYPNSYADLIANRHVNPDRDCVFGCNPSWQIYTNRKIERNRFGYHPKCGDIIAWEIQAIDRLKNNIFKGLWYYSEIMPTLDVTILMNGVEQKLTAPSCYKAVCRIDLVRSLHMSTGDTIQVEVKSVVEDGFINSIQPSLVH